MKSDIQVYIITHNRPNLIIKAIDSVIQQSYKNMEIIVSDNSTDNLTEEIIMNNYQNKVKYIRRMPNAPHFNIILKEVTSDFFMIFHDDDIMHPDMVEVLYNHICNDSAIIAVASNAFIIKNSKSTGKTFLPVNEKIIFVNTPDEMALHQLRLKHALFPSYLYRKEVSEKVSVDFQQGGKNADVSFLMKIAKLGKIVWVCSPLMDYYIHAGQDGYTNDFMGRLSLISFINANSIYNKKSIEIRNYRLANFYAEYKTRLRKRQVILLKRKILCLFLRYSPLKYFIRTIVFEILFILKRIN